MRIINQIKQDFLNIVLLDGIDVLKPDNTKVKAIFRESSNNEDLFSDEVSGTEIFIIGMKDDLSDLKIDDVLVIGTQSYKVISKEDNDFRIKLRLSEL